MEDFENDNVILNKLTTIRFSRLLSLHLLSRYQVVRQVDRAPRSRSCVSSSLSSKLSERPGVVRSSDSDVMSFNT